MILESSCKWITMRPVPQSPKSSQVSAEHRGFDELHSRMTALRSSLTLDPRRQRSLAFMLQSLDWDIAKREEAEPGLRAASRRLERA